jgi:hyperosmotically inducible protein
MTSRAATGLRAAAAVVLIVVMSACAAAARPGAAATAAPPTDQTLKLRVETSLMNASGVHGREVTTEVTQGVATLSGSLHSQAEIDAAIAAARKVEGLRDVRSNLKVQ